MKKGGLFFLLIAITASVAADVGTAQTCNVCNCQFNNVQVLTQLIDAQMNRILSNEPRKLHACMFSTINTNPIMNLIIFLQLCVC